MGISLSPAAIARVQQFTAQDINALGLRFGVKKMGCSGWAYEVDVALDERAQDQVFDCEGVKIFVDAASLAVVDGTEIDFQRQGLNSNFVFKNPRMTAACGCGESFSVDREAI